MSLQTQSPTPAKYNLQEDNPKLNSGMFDDTVKNRITSYNNFYYYLMIYNIILLLLYSIYFCGLGYSANHGEKDNREGPYDLGKKWDREYSLYIVGGFFSILFIYFIIFFVYRDRQNKNINAALTLADSMGNLYSAGLGANDTIQSMGTILTPYTGNEEKDKQTEQAIRDGYAGAAAGIATKSNKMRHIMQ